MRLIFKKIILILNLIFALLLLGCYLAAFIDTEKFFLLGLLSLSYPMLLFLNIGFIIFWALLLKRLFLISFIIIIIRIDYIPSFFQLKKQTEVSKSEDQIRIMSFNVSLFTYNNQENHVENTLHLIEKWEPTIVCMQEFPGVLKDNSTLNRIRARVGNYNYSPKELDGNVIVSKYPIIHRGIVDMELLQIYRLIFADIVINCDTIRLYNLHLASFNLDNDDIEAFEQITGKYALNIEKNKIITQKLIATQKEHAREMKVIKRHIAESPYKIIICGDFNDTPASHAYHQLRKGLKDTFVQKGRGYGATYHGSFPSFRIDFIFHPNNYKTIDYISPKTDISDHSPIFAVLEAKKKIN